MRHMLSALIRLANRTGRFTVAEATRIYNDLWFVIWVMLVGCVIAFLANAVLGWKSLSLVLAMAFAVVAVYLWAKPLHILAVTGAGAGWGLARRIAGDALLADEVMEVLRAYLRFLKWALLMVVTFLFITGTVSFRENPRAMLPLLVALGVIGLFTWMWPRVFSGTWGRRLVYSYAVLVVVTSLGSLIPGALWVKYTGHDPTQIGTTKVDETVYKIREAQKTNQENTENKILEGILEKVEAGQPLTTEEQRLLERTSRSKEAEQAKASKHVAQSCGFRLNATDCTFDDTGVEVETHTHGLRLCFGPEPSVGGYTLWYKAAGSSSWELWRMGIKEPIARFKFVAPIGQTKTATLQKAPRC